MKHFPQRSSGAQNLLFIEPKESWIFLLCKNGRKRMFIC